MQQSLTAAAAAQKAVDFILGTRFDEEDSHDRDVRDESADTTGALVGELARAA